jgi:hypothetical protein
MARVSEIMQFNIPRLFTHMEGRLGDVINGFRVKTLNLDPISPLWGHVLLSRMKVPFTYCWYISALPHLERLN